MRKTVIEKYLERYAEEEAGNLPPMHRKWKHVVCIPACNEAESLMITLESLAAANAAEDALVVVVVNGRASAPTDVHENNAELCRRLKDKAELAEGFIALGRIHSLDLLVIDRWSDGRYLPEKQGVGLARKIAGDVALSLFASGSVEDRWIRCTDADVQVPRDYFQQLLGLGSGVSSAIYSFEHIPEGDAVQQAAMGAYDRYLQSYVDGLSAAGSPYAFHTIGSLISVQADSYAAVRGIPKRLAGEDFYLLNKLAKVGSVVSLDGDPVRIRGRLSDRVPFGTGAALRDLCAVDDDLPPFQPYAPHIFDGLAHWLSALESFVMKPNVDVLRATIQVLPEPLGSVLYTTLTSMCAFEAAEKASQQVSGAHLHRRLMEWNDAFRTMKLVHGLRAQLSALPS